MRQEVLHGHLWMEHPVKVIADDGNKLAVLLEPGSPFTFHTHPQGAHPWSAHAAWKGTEVLQLYRSGDLYSVWRIFEDGVFRRWYLNFEAAIIRRGQAFETVDYGLDLLIEPDGSWVWKDVEGMNGMRREGRMTTAQIMDVLAAAESVVEDIGSNHRWWSSWDDWHPTSQ